MAWVSIRLSGCAPDLPQDALPPEIWSYFENVQMRDGVAERSVGDNDKDITATPITRWEYAVPINTPTASAIFYGGDDYAGPRARCGTFVMGGGHVDQTPVGWAATAAGRNAWTGGPFGGGALLHSSKAGQGPVWLSSGFTLTTITATIFNAVRPYKYMAVGIGDKTLAGYQNTVRWSASVVPGAAPSTWGPLATNDAGDFDITTSSHGTLVDGGRCGEDFIIYGENSTHLMTYVGGAAVMASRSLAVSSGIMARNCWADIGGAHAVLTKDDIVLVNASGVVKSIADNRVRRTIFTNLYNSDGRHLSSKVWWDRERGRVYVALSRSSDLHLTEAWVYEVATDTWGYRSLLNTAADGTGEIKYIHGAVLATTDTGLPVVGRPRLSLLGRGGAAGVLADCQCQYLDSNAVRSSKAEQTVMRKDDLDLGDASRLKVITGIRLRGTAPSTVTLKVKIGTKNASDEAYTYSAEQDVILPSTQRAPFLVTGRWISVNIRCVDDTNVQYRLMGFDLEVQPGGEW